MTVMAAVRAMVPGLRRYARAALGVREAADACVSRSIEAFIEGSTDGPDLGELRRRVYRRLYIELAAAAAASVQPHEITDMAALEVGVRELEPVARHCLLLHALERLGIADIAEIVDLPVDEVRGRLEAAYAGLRRQPAVRVLIIEDDPIIASDLAGIVEAAGHAVAGVAPDFAQAVAAARASRPGLVLADVELTGSPSGIEALQAIRDEMEVPAIFVTGFPERALASDASVPVFVVSKPFDERLLQVTMAQALRPGVT